MKLPLTANLINRLVRATVQVIISVTLISTSNPAIAAKNIILMIGDGMGPEQVKAGSYYLTGQEGKLLFEPYFKGTVRTAPIGGGVTDSAAAATAIATGNKVNNGVLSQAPNGLPYMTILEKAKALGKRTGLVSTVSIADATPAAFGAHESSRGNKSNIVNDYLNGSMPNVLLGGGLNDWSVAQINGAQSRGYQFVTDKDGLEAVNPSTQQYTLGLFAGGDMAYEYDRPTSSYQPHLSEMATKALSIVEKDPDGFFLMVEGGSIDHACHSSNIQRATKEVIEFHNTFDVMLNWVQTHLDTLLIVTADHETGGLSVVHGNGAGNYVTASWTGNGGHTGINVPFYITGANADLANQYVVNGSLENTDIFRIMDKALVVPEAASLTIFAFSLAGLAVMEFHRANCRSRL